MYASACIQHIIKKRIAYITLKPSIAQKSHFYTDYHLTQNRIDIIQDLNIYTMFLLVIMKLMRQWSEKRCDEPYDALTKQVYPKINRNFKFLYKHITDRVRDKQIKEQQSLKHLICLKQELDDDISGLLPDSGQTRRASLTLLGQISL